MAKTRLIRTFKLLTLLCCVSALVCSCGSAIDHEYSSTAYQSDPGDPADSTASQPLFYGAGFVNLTDPTEELFQIVPMNSPLVEGVKQLFFGKYLEATIPFSNLSISTIGAFYDFSLNNLNANIGFQVAVASASSNYYETEMTFPVKMPSNIVFSVPGPTVTFDYIGKTFQQVERFVIGNPNATNFSFSIAASGKTTGTPPTTSVTNMTPNGNYHTLYAYRSPATNIKGTNNGFDESLNVTGFGLDAVASVTVSDLVTATISSQSDTAMTISFSGNGCGDSSIPRMVTFKDNRDVVLDEKPISCTDFPAIGTRRHSSLVNGDRIWFVQISCDYISSGCPILGSNNNNFFGDFLEFDEAYFEEGKVANYMNQTRNTTSSNLAPNAVCAIVFIDKAPVDGILKTDELWWIDTSFNQPLYKMAYGGPNANEYTNYACPRNFTPKKTNGGVIVVTLAPQAPTLP